MEYAPIGYGPAPNGPAIEQRKYIKVLIKKVDRDRIAGHTGSPFHSVTDPVLFCGSTVALCAAPCLKAPMKADPGPASPGTTLAYYNVEGKKAKEPKEVHHG
jgi:hypothetical protein